MTAQIQNSVTTRIPTQQQLALVFGKSNRTIRRWQKSRPILKLGRKSKVNDFNLTLFLCNYISNNSTLTQREMTDYLSQQIGQPITQQAVSWILKKNRITRKRATKQYLGAR